MDEGAPSLVAQRSKRRYIIGIACLMVVVALWVGSSTLIQSIFHSSGFNHPFFLTYFSTSLFTFYLFSYYIQYGVKHYCRRHHHEPVPLHDNSASDQTITTAVADGQSHSTGNGNSPNGRRASGTRVVTSHGRTRSEEEKSQLLHVLPAEPPTKLTAGATARLSLALCPLWFLMNYLFNLSLDLTTVASNTILSTTSGFFVLIFSYCLLKSKFKLHNLIGVCFTIGGAVLISLRDNSGDSGDEDTRRIVIGDICACCSAVFYASYTVMLKVQVPDESVVEMQLLFGFMGLWNMLLFLPLFPLVHYIGLESFEMPSGTVIGYLLLNGFFGTVISDFMWAKSVLLTSPLIASIGLALTIPVAMLSDFIFAGSTFSVWYFLGSASVLSGFVLVNYNYSKTLTPTRDASHTILSDDQSAVETQILADNQT